MIKKFLLATSALSFALASSAETEVYVIKDGKMVNAEFVPSADAPEESYEIEESTNAAGDAMVKVKNPVEKYKSGLIYLPEAVDLSEAWNLEVEYYFEEDTKLTDDCNKRQCWNFSLMADTLPVGTATWKTNPAQKEYRIAYVSIDAKMRDFYSCVDGKAVNDNHGLGSLRTVRKYVYSNPLLPAGVAERGDGNKVKAIFIALFPEAGAEIVGYIKNLKFVSDGIKPFYADKMTKLAGEGTIYMATFNNLVYGTNDDDADGKISAIPDNDVKTESNNPTEMYGQQLFISNNPDGYTNELLTDRMYCDEGEQGEVDFYDTEYGFLPYMLRAIDGERAYADEVVADAQLRIPLGSNAVEKTISIAMRLGHNAGESGKKVPYADYMSESKDIRFPVEYRFEKGDAKTISDKTEWKQFVPTYTKGGDDKVDSIPTMMSMVYGDVELPSKEYTHITLRFIPNDIISYMFGDIRLTGDIDAWPRTAKDYVLGEDFDGNMIPVGFKGVSNAVENIVAKGEISIYPNPASDVVTVTNEGVKSVSVYSIAGTLVASSQSNTVNVAALANGIYLVKANTEAGVITGQIIKK